MNWNCVFLNDDDAKGCIAAGMQQFSKDICLKINLSTFWFKSLLYGKENNQKFNNTILTSSLFQYTVEKLTST